MEAPALPLALYYDPSLPVNRGCPVVEGVGTWKPSLMAARRIAL